MAKAAKQYVVMNVYNGEYKECSDLKTARILLVSMRERIKSVFEIRRV